MAKKSFILSTEEINCYNIRIKTAGIKLSQFNQNPIMLYMHQRGNVIGGWENLRVEDSKLLGDADFDLEDVFAKNIARKVDRNYLRATSIGVTDYVYHFEKAGDTEILVMDECELYEVSIVDVPANRSALRLYDKDRKEIDLSKGLMQFKLGLIESPKPSKTNMDLKAMAKVFGLSEDATEEQITLAAQAAQKASADLVNMQNQQKEAQKKRAITLVDAAITEKRLDVTKKETFLKLAENNFELFEETLKSIPAPLSLKNVANGTVELPVSVALSDEKKKWSYEDWRKNDPTGLLRLSKSDRETYEVLFEAEYGEKPEKD